MFGLIVLRAIGMSCIITVLSQHVQMAPWEGCLLGFGAMMVLGTLYDVRNGLGRFLKRDYL